MQSKFHTDTNLFSLMGTSLANETPGSLSILGEHVAGEGNVSAAPTGEKARLSHTADVPEEQ